MAQLRRINFDSTWLITLPCSKDYPTKTCNLLLDPWLSPAEQIDLSITFSGQKRIVPALASSIAELEELLEKENKEERQNSTKIDGIIISHPFSDHLHPETLLDEKVAERIPIFVTEDAEPVLKKLLASTKRKHRLIRIGQTSMKDTPEWVTQKKVPKNIQILQALPQEKCSILQGPAGMAWKKLHGGLIFVWRDEEQAKHSLIYSPHGISSTSIPHWLTDSQFTHWAIMTMYDRLLLPNWLSGPVNLGLAEPLEMIQKGTYPAHYIIDTHGEHKEKRGLVAKLLRRYWLNSERLIDGYDAEREAKRKEQAQERINQVSSNSSAKAILLQVGERLPLC